MSMMPTHMSCCIFNMTGYMSLDYVKGRINTQQYNISRECTVTCLQFCCTMNWDLLGGGIIVAIAIGMLLRLWIRTSIVAACCSSMRFCGYTMNGEQYKGKWHLHRMPGSWVASTLLWLCPRHWGAASPSPTGSKCTIRAIKTKWLKTYKDPPERQTAWHHLAW